MISPAFTEDQTLFTAVSQLGIFRSADGGRSWDDITKGMSFRAPSPIDLVSDDSGGVLLALVVPDRAWESSAPEFHPRILRSDDLGMTWHLVIAPVAGPIRSLIALPDGRVMAEDGAGALSTHALENFQPLAGAHAETLSDRGYVQRQDHPLGLTPSRRWRQTIACKPSSE